MDSTWRFNDVKLVVLHTVDGQPRDAATNHGQPHGTKPDV